MMGTAMTPQYDFSNSTINESASRGIRARLSRELEADIQARFYKSSGGGKKQPVQKSRKRWMRKIHQHALYVLGDSVLYDWEYGPRQRAIVFLDPTPFDGGLWCFVRQIDAKHFTDTDCLMTWKISQHAVSRSIERCGGTFALTTPRDIMKATLDALYGPEDPAGYRFPPPGNFNLLCSYGYICGEVSGPGEMVIKTVLPAAALLGRKLTAWQRLPDGEVDLVTGLAVGTGAGECSS